MLAFVALGSAALSAVTGVAGGILLLSVLLLTVEPEAVVPIHAAVQLVANGSRLLIFRRSVDSRLVLLYAATSTLGAIAAIPVVSALSPALLRVAIAAAILASVFAPKPKQAMSSRAFSFLGFTTGFLGLLVGSTGPLLTAGLLARGVVKEAHIGTKAACQSVAHAVKLVLFSATLGFDFAGQGALIGLLGVMVVVGTHLGRRVLGRLSEARFRQVTRVLLVLVALKTLIEVGWGHWSG